MTDTELANSAPSAVKTPPRNNYANSTTPIASIKRPRSSADDKTPTRRTSSQALSPLHPPSAAVREEEELFSPSLHYDAEIPRKVSNDAKLEDDDTQSIESLSVADMDTEEDDFNPWQFIKSLPDYATVKHLTPPVALPPKPASAPKLTVVLDLDETLVHCTVEEPQDSPPADFSFPVVFHGTEYQVYVRLRPHLFDFLAAIKNRYEIVVFTASQKVYADELLNRIDPQGDFIHHRLFRESCLAVEGNFLKDLTVLGRDLSSTVLVDNSPHAFGYQLDNGIPIESWFDAGDDRELLKLERFLRQLESVEDVREHCRLKFGLAAKVAAAPDYPL